MFEWLRLLEPNRNFAQTWVTHFIDMVVVFIIIYEILKLVRDTRAVQMAAGIAVVAGLYVVARLLHLDTLLFLMRNAMVYVGFGIIVLFQAEIRTALTHFGKNLRNPFWRTRDKKPLDSFDEIILATTTFSAQKIGALIVFERTVGLQDYINRGVRMDAVLSYDLLVNIFNTNAPLHDGAVVIRNRRIAAASCFLPLTLNPRLSKDLGTRHRAAIGITEESDAFVVVVSEETGVVSVIEQGHITRNLDSRKLRQVLTRAMNLSEPPAPRRYRRRSFVLDASMPPDSSMSDVPSETPPSGTPVLTAAGRAPTPAKRVQEMGYLQIGPYWKSGRESLGGLGQTLRNLAFKNGRLKLIAAALTVGLWFAATSQQDIVPYSLRGVQVVYENLPTSLTISNREAVEEVTVRVRGPRDLVERLRPESFGINVPLGDKSPGNIVIRLREKDGDAIIQKPDGLEILEIVPQRLTVNLERVVERPVEVKPSFKGDLPTDFRVSGMSVSPSTTVLRGPEGRIYELQSVGTETIWLNTRRAPFREKYKIDVNDPRVEVLSPADQVVEVNVNVQLTTATREFPGIEIRPSAFSETLAFSPRTATVIVEGPKSVVEKMTPWDVSVIAQNPDPANSNHIVLAGKLSPNLGAVRILSLAPPVVQRTGKR